VKNQYFADKRDLVKYDLILEILETIPRLNSLTSLLMLTEDDQTNEGKLKSFPVGNRRPHLHTFLQGCIEKRSTIRELRGFYKSVGIQYNPYSDEDLFSHEKRATYFQSVSDDLLNNALVFLDPDIGFEPPSFNKGNRGPEKYILWSDWEKLALRISGDSIFVVYQHSQNDKTKLETDLAFKCRKMARGTNLESIIVVRDRDVAFLIAGFKSETHKHLMTALHDYSGLHEDLVFGVVGIEP